LKQQDRRDDTKSAKHAGTYVINRTNGIRERQGHGRIYAGRPNIGQTRLNNGIEDLDRPKKKKSGLYRTKKIDGIIYRTKEADRIIQDQEDRRDHLQDKGGR
jgi:hypothetical protein